MQIEGQYSVLEDQSKFCSTFVLYKNQICKDCRIIYLLPVWIRGLMAINVGFEFRDRGSIPSVCQITGWSSRLI